MTDEVPALDGLPEGRFSGRQVFTDLVRQAFATAARDGWPRMVLCDPDFADWPLGERVVVEALNAWSARGRSLHLLAHEFGPLRELHPRFVQWRITWSHLVEARTCSGVSADGLPSVLWSPAWTLQRLDMQRATLVASCVPERRVALREELQSWWQRGTPAFPASILGL